MIVLVDVSGENYETVSQVIQSPVGTVKSRLSRARLRMQECLNNKRELLPEQFRLNIEDENV